MYQQSIKAIPTGRMGLPVDIANLVAFLVSDEASFITGQCIVCDGGYTLP
jgi:NAD(P)-dependent dehydrogenase (short-subunit alcohol dehydrogenase family)